MFSACDCFVVTLVFILIPSAFSDSSVPSVTLPFGHINGRLEYVEESFHSISAFLGIPYAEPPVGKLRFARPEPWASVWAEDLDASEYGAFCPQNRNSMKGGWYEPCCLPDVSAMSEDCLQLNVFTPDPSKSFPVLVFIHGGGYIHGSGVLYDGSALAAIHDLVVVTMNYRLAPFGYIHDDQKGTQRPATGHLGHLDQRTALQWIQKYIQYFGGDPSLVTLAGQSAGAASVTFHLLSEESRGLFSRAIIHSDYTLVSSQPKTGDSTLNRLLVKLNCGEKEKFECLLEKTTEQIVETIEEDHKGAERDLARWRAVFDGVNLADDPHKQLEALNFTQVPVLIGVTANEGWGLSSFLLPETTQDDLTLTYQGHFIPATRKFLSDLFGADVPHFNELLAAVLDFNFGKSPKMLDNEGFLRRRWSDFVGDIYMRAPTTWLAQYLSGSGQPTYFYEFSHRPWHIRSERPSGHVGCDHGSEVQFFWGFPFLNSHSRCNTSYSSTETSFAKETMTYYANFIKSGNPNSGGLFQWPEFSRSREDYIILQPSFMKASGYKQDRVNFYMGKLHHLRNKYGKHQTHDEL